MYYIERKSKILELLQEERSVSVDSLAMAFDVSKETIRRDLRQMESEGLLTRTHGGAVPLTTAFTVPAPSPAEPPVDIRSTFNNDIKHSLCRKAASYIKEGDNVIYRQQLNYRLSGSIYPGKYTGYIYYEFDFFSDRIFTIK